MGFLKSFYAALFFSLAVLLLGYGTACNEYSYEGGLLPDTLTRPDTVVAPPDTTINVDTVLFAPCAVCKHATSLVTGQWNFRSDTSFLCGTISNAVMNTEKDAFTFFGPSACTPGTGLIITAYFGAGAFTTDRAGVVSSRTTLQYYDNNAVQDILRFGAGTVLSLTVTQFEQATGIAIGRFNGTALTAEGKIVEVKEGNFKVQF